jgi:hypothetical protein
MGRTINPWSQHYQSIWRERAVDLDYPLWQRVAWLAWGTHRSNGHAGFAQGELAEIVGAKSSSQLSHALRKAKLKRLLEDESEPQCLIVPAHAIQGGDPSTSPNEPCAIHTGKRLLTTVEYHPVISEVTHGR